MLANIDRPSINNVAGNIMRDLDRTFERVVQFKAWLDTLPDADLIGQLGYIQGDINVLRSALSDLNQLSAIYRGTQALPAAKDFGVFPRQVYPYGSIG